MLYPTNEIAKLIGKITLRLLAILLIRAPRFVRTTKINVVRLAIIN